MAEYDEQCASKMVVTFNHNSDTFTSTPQVVQHLNKCCKLNNIALPIHINFDNTRKGQYYNNSYTISDYDISEQHMYE